MRANTTLAVGQAVLAGACLLLALPATARAEAVVLTASGDDAAAIAAVVDQFRVLLGSTLNTDASTALLTGRREVAWDDVDDQFASPFTFPGRFVGTHGWRQGAELQSPGLQEFQVSMDDDSGLDADADQVRFAQFNPAYASMFKTFSGQRLFTAMASTITEVTFSGGATVRGFGVVFADVDVVGSTMVACFDEHGALLHVATAPVSNNGLSFVGVWFDAGERVARVRIVAGNGVLSSGVAESEDVDVVAMDDMLFSEPQAVPVSGILDTSFGTGGVTKVEFGGTARATALALQPDGKLVMVGTTGVDDSERVALVRLGTDGMRDPAFGDDGRTIATFTSDVGGAHRAWAVALQPGGGIVVAGVANAGPTSDFGLARFDHAGQWDPAFGNAGLLTVDFGGADEARALLVQPDGRIVVAGHADDAIAVARLLPDGRLDPTFNPTTAPTADNGNGRLRLAPGTFTASGTTNSSAAAAIALDRDGRILLAGHAGPSGDLVVVRLNPDGTLDGTFGAAGVSSVALSPAAVGMILLPDGGIITGGTWALDSDFALARLLSTGALATTFNATTSPSLLDGNGRLLLPHGGALTHDRLGGIALQADGKIVIVGTYTFVHGTRTAIVRVRPEGSLDTSFGSEGSVVLDLDTQDEANAILIQADGRIVVAGRLGSDMGVSRLLAGADPGMYIALPTSAADMAARAPFAFLQGTAGDDVAVTHVTWKSDRGFSGEASGTNAWWANVPLLAGANTITVSARDVDGRTSSDTLSVTVEEFEYVFSEGATGRFFDATLLLANPTDVDALVAVEYLKPDGTTVPQTLTVAAQTRQTVAHRPRRWA